MADATAAPATAEELLAILGSLRGDIVEVESSMTGTPLPERYKPAAPLASV